MPCRLLTRRAMTMLEMVIVVVFIGIFAALALPRLGPTLLSNFGSEADARRLALDLLQAQRYAITTGDNHFIQFVMSGSNATGYTVMRRTGGTTTAVDAPHTFASQVTVTPSAANAEFQFDGSALASYQIDLVGPNQTWRVTVVQITGAIKAVKL
jgi:type II secretory pathway pseudopilin PulG